MVEQESEAHLRREQIKQQLETAKKAGNLELEEQCKKMLRQYNQDAKHYMNVIDLSGNVGLFKIGHRGYTALKSKIDTLRAEGVDPIGIETGRYFIFSRSGRGIDTVYTVEEYKQKQKMTGPNGNEVVVDVPFNHAIDDAIMSKLDTDAFELLDVYPTVTAEEEQKIVHGGPAGVDEVFKRNTNTQTQQPQAQAQQQTAPAPQPETDMSKAMGAPVAAPTQAPTETATVQTENVATTVDTNTGEVLNETPVANTSTGSTDLSNMSEEEFFERIQV